MTFWCAWLLACSMSTPTAADGTFPAVNPPDPTSCESHVDCVLSCAVDGSCCTPACGCREPRNRDAESAVVAQHTAMCASGGFDCPVRECTGDESLVVPRCVDGRCVALQRPE
ncbi:MAG: hypothetical protein ACI8PZ_002279 [Myxococcota bacterium]|jgi:hypothetical protein